MGSSMIESAREVNTNNKLDAIEEALTAFRLANNRLPCPGDATLTDTAANANTYGYEAGYNAANNPADSCNGGSPTANYFYTLPSPSTNTLIAGGTSIAEGAVPVKTLGLPDEFQYDGWGRKFAYAVWAPLTATDAFITYGVYPSCGAITVENGGLPAHGDRTTTGAYALISFGPNGHGGYLQNGSRYFMGSDNTDEWTNCHCNAVTNVAGTANNAPATYVEQEATQTNPNDPLSAFDDIVRYKASWQMQNAYDTYTPNGAQCTPGFRIDGDLPSGNLGVAIAVADVNGDGIPDLILVGQDTSNSWLDLYVIYGKNPNYGWPNPLELSTYLTNPSNGFIITHIANNAQWGDKGETQISNAGIITADLNGDGIPDIIVLTQDYVCVRNTYAYVIFGQTGSVAAAKQDFTTLGSTSSPQVTKLQAGTACGGDLQNTTVADVNGDGINDIILSDLYYTPGGRTSAGGVFVYFGHPTQAELTNHTYPNAPSTVWPSSLNISDLTGGTAKGGSYGFVIEGPAANADMGGTVASADLDHNGIKDLVMNQYCSSGCSEQAWIVWGQGPSFNWPAMVDLNALTAETSCVSGDSCGVTLATNHPISSGLGGIIVSGDFNGDAIDDVAMNGTDSNGQNTNIYVIYGQNGAWSVNNLNVNTMASTQGVDINNGTSCWSPSAPGDQVADVNGDGKTDLLLQDLRICNPPYWTTEDYISVFNNAWGANGSWNINNINGANGFEFDIPDKPMSYYSKVAAADLNADGINETVITDASHTVNSNSNAGSTYIIWGKSSYAAYSGTGLYVSGPGVFDTSSTYEGSAWSELDGDYANEYSGQAVTTGDLNNDGKADLIIGAPGNTPSSTGLSNSGSVYVIFGGKNLPSEIPGGAITLETLINR